MSSRLLTAIKGMILRKYYILVQASGTHIPLLKLIGIKMLYLYSEFIPKYGMRTLRMVKRANTFWETMIMCSKRPSS